MIYAEVFLYQKIMESKTLMSFIQINIEIMLIAVWLQIQYVLMISLAGLSSYI